MSQTLGSVFAAELKKNEIIKKTSGLIEPQTAWLTWKDAVSLQVNLEAKPMAGLKWRSKTTDLVAVQVTSATQDLGLSTTLEGMYLRPGWTLLWKSQKITLDSQNRFRMKVNIVAQSTTLKIAAIGPHGEVEQQQAILWIQGWDTVLAKVKKNPSSQTTFVSTLLSLTTISYQETLQGRSFSLWETALTARVSYNIFIKRPLWDIGVSSYFTLLPLTKSNPNALRFLGVNLRVGYLFPSHFGGWTLGLYGGMYYTTTFVSGGGKFGFENMQGPQFYPVLRRQLKAGTTIMGYVKFSPMSSQYSFFSYSSHELALGGIYSDMLSNGHPLSFSIDLSRLSFNVSEVQFTGSSMTASIGVGYGL